MKIVIQKVKNAKVVVADKVKGQINKGFVLLVGIEADDTEKDVIRAAQKISKLRLFEDEDDKINLSIEDVKGEILSISQFTLAGDLRKGNRPSFTNAKKPDEANAFYEIFNETLKSLGIHVETGIFQTHMNVILDNDGPITMILEVKDGKVL